MAVEPVGGEFEEGWPAVGASPCHSIQVAREHHHHRIHSGILPPGIPEACRPGNALFSEITRRHERSLPRRPEGIPTA